MGKRRYVIRELPKDAGTGRFVKKQYALNNPDKTYFQTVKVKLRKK